MEQDLQKEKIVTVSWKRTVFVCLGVLFYISFWNKLKGCPKTIYNINLILLIGLIVKIQIPDEWRKILAWVEIILASVFGFIIIEQLHGNVPGEMKLLYASLNYLLIITFFLLIQGIFNRFIVTILIGTGGCVFYGLLYSFVKEFRGNGLRAADIYAAKTAMNVAEGYTLVFTEEKLMAIAIAITFIILSFYISYKQQKGDRLKYGAFAAASTLLVLTLFSNDIFMEKNGVKPYVWELEASEKDHGALLDFAAGIPYLKMKTPKQYSHKTALMMEKNRQRSQVIENAEEKRYPHIIAIMNESFSDFRKLGALELNQEIFSNWDALSENVIKGFVSVPVFGGWTANSEFEFITGFSNAFFPSGTIPYQNYVTAGIPNLNSQLKQYGYSSTFIHPMYDTGWNRKTVYPTMDFEETCYLDDMADPKCLRNVISDRSDYEEVIKRFEKNKKDGPTFIFNVTIQNHGGYTWGGIENPVKILSPEGNFSQAEEYLTLIRESDQALRELLNYFEQEQEPVVVCMFGDHYPKVEEELYQALGDNSSGSDVEKTARKYQVPFMIYANFDIQEAQYENISLNYLSTLLCKTANIPLTDYQQYLCGLYEKFPVVNVYGVKNNEGQWFTWDEAMKLEEIKEYEMVQYRNLFDRQKK